MIQTRAKQLRPAEAVDHRRNREDGETREPANVWSRPGTVDPVDVSDDLEELWENVPV